MVISSVSHAVMAGKRSAFMHHISHSGNKLQDDEIENISNMM